MKKILMASAQAWKMILVLFTAICTSMPLYTQQAHQLDAALAQMNNDPDLRSATWGFCAIDVQSGQVISEFNSEKSMVTASVMKAVTTATALGILGTGFRFETYLEYDGEIEAHGTLNGNLYLRGTGDPTLGSDRFEGNPDVEDIFRIWAEAIQQEGITRIEGKVIADASIFDSQLTPGNWSWEDMGNYYGAGVAGLNIHENLYRLDFKPGQTTGSRTEIIRTVPFMDQLSFINEVTTGAVGSGDNAYIFGSPYTNIRFIRGTIPGGRNVFSIKGSISDPVRFIARHLYETIGKCDIPVIRGYSTMLDEQRTNVHNERNIIHIHQSPFLSEIVKETNLESINLYAEALLKRIAAERRRPGSTRVGLKIVDEYWESMQIDTKGMLLRDGSGLSSNNVLSPRQIATILQKTYHTTYGDALWQSLPVAGRSGSLKNMLRGTRAEGRLRAKSGYISAVRSYAGYVETSGNRLVAFAMLANNFTCSAGQMRIKFERLMVKMAEMY